MSADEMKSELRSLKAEIKRLRKSLSELTPPLSALLRRRGFKIYKKEPSADLLIPEERFVDTYYRFLTKYSFRLFLRDVIKYQERFTPRDVSRYATQRITTDYIKVLLGIGLINNMDNADTYCLQNRPIRSFGPTLEWFVSEIFKREFAVEAIWGIKFKRPVVGGDYDLIAKIDGSILDMEIKSSPPKQIYANEITAFFTRVFDLRPDVTIFFMDTELRMKDKIVPMFEDELRKRSSDDISVFFGVAQGPRELPRIQRIEKELFHIEDKIFIINAADSIVHNIEKVLTRFFRRSYA